jgi:4-hydroxythreonine-4-phosphate dehydrogenase
MTIAVTSGDPSGIGPEIVQKSWIYLKNNPSNEFFWIGDPLHLPDKSIPWQPIVHPNEVSKNFSSALPVLVHKFAHPLKIGCHQP